MPYWHPDDVNLIQKRTDNMTSKKIDNSEHEYRFIKKTGETIRIRALQSPIRNSDGIFEYVNLEFTKIYGYGEEIIGKDTPRILESGKMDNQRYDRFWENILNKQIIKGAITNKTKDGRLINVQSSVNPILDDKENIIGFLSIQCEIFDYKL